MGLTQELQNQSICQSPEVHPELFLSHHLLNLVLDFQIPKHHLRQLKVQHCTLFCLDWFTKLLPIQCLLMYYQNKSVRRDRFSIFFIFLCSKVMHPRLLLFSLAQ